MKKLNTIMGIVIGLYIGYCASEIWMMKQHPEWYVGQSAPSYANILLYGALALVVLLVCIILKAAIKHRSKKSENKPTK